ncbi:acyl-CoA thioesterase [Stenoxybacter acetivorans]|uniref:acyl-CoA thioesterase n=1 Tax=Stenoxybacter acetivorans TaxID=422441 RepID=UPI00056169F3|nr:acyl-CoA thioesterase [Stenoxybacter acetivorans]
MRRTESAYCSHFTDITVPFFDVDSMFIVWHGHYVKYLEVSRCAFLSALQYDYTVMREHGFGWPIIKMDLKYIRPAQFGQKLQVELRLLEYETYLKCGYIIRDAASNEKLTEATTTQAAVNIISGEMQLQTPESWQTAVRRYLAQKQ